MKNPYNVPHYPNNVDYTTNAASYYDDLARKNELMKHLAMRIWEYDKELSKRFAEWDENLSTINEDVIQMMIKWMEDGTLDHIINHNIFNDLLDQIKANDVDIAALVEKVDGIRKQLHPNTLYLEGMKRSVIRSTLTEGREEMQIYATGDPYTTGSDGSGMHLYGNGDGEHAGNITFLTGQNDMGTARMTITGGSSNPLSEGYRTNTDTRVTIGNDIWDFVDNQEDTAMLNLKNPIDRPAICFYGTGANEGELAIPTGEQFSIGHWDGQDFTERVAVDGFGRLLVNRGGNGQKAEKVDDGHTPHIQGIGDTQSTSSMLLSSFSNSVLSSANIYLMKSPSSTIGTHSAARDGDVLGEVMFGGSDGEKFATGAAITTSARGGNWTLNSKPTHLQIRTTPVGANTPSTRMTFNPDGSIAAGSDNSQTLGTASYRWSQVYAGTGSISTSDRKAKQQISPITDEVLDAWEQMDYSMYKFNDAVEKKGDKARYHFGIIAQQIAEVFEQHDLNAMDYGLLCVDTLEDGTERWGVRTDECLMLEAALMRRELKKLKG